MDKENKPNSRYQGDLSIYEMVDTSNYQDNELPKSNSGERRSYADYALYLGAGSAALCSVTTSVLMEYHEEIMDASDNTLEFALETISSLS